MFLCSFSPLLLWIWIWWNITKSLQLTRICYVWIDQSIVKKEEDRQTCLHWFKKILLVKSRGPLMSHVWILFCFVAFNAILVPLADVIAACQRALKVHWNAFQSKHIISCKQFFGQVGLWKTNPQRFDKRAPKPLVFLFSM